MRIVAGMSMIVACAAVPANAQETPSPAAVAPIVTEARAFMADYARDLLAGNRDGIAGRYDPRGALVQGNGTSRMESAASTLAYYRSAEWQPFTSFEWRDLHYEPHGPDAVTVAGIFLYERPNNPLRIVSYTGLLVRRDGRLRIRLEHESAAPVRP